MTEWQMQLTKGMCPRCWNNPLAKERNACERCLKTNAKAMRRYYARHRAKMREYQRVYHKARRDRLRAEKLAVALPEPILAEATPPEQEWLAARELALQELARREAQ